MYTVKKLADLAGVSTRALRYYHQIGLLKPAAVGENGYRYYDDDTAVRLQQILFYREMEISLSEIRDILEQPDFDLLGALGAHKTMLESKKQRIDQLLNTVEYTMNYLEGKLPMNENDIFGGFSEDEQKTYADEARQRWDSTLVDGSQKRWASYPAEKKKVIMAEANAIYKDIYANRHQGHDSQKIQHLVGDWHRNLRYFYEPAIGTLRGLGQMYCDDSRFRANFEKFSLDFPEFLRAAIEHYCDQAIA
ncbi:MAG: MerR family transcriptional regulator [Chloroflexota bacterium]